VKYLRRRVHLGGKAHLGRQVADAAQPLPTPRAEGDVDLLIEGDEDGAQLYWRGRDGSAKAGGVLRSSRRR
jgi:hypothetical protein